MIQPSQPAGDEGAYQSTPAAASNDRELPDRHALEKVLRETVAAATRRGDALVGQDLEALRLVYQRYAGEPLVLEPITVDLVYAVLVSHFHQLSPAEVLWREMSAQIAQTMWDDDGTQQRLLQLWNRLGESQS